MSNTLITPTSPTTPSNDTVQTIAAIQQAQAQQAEAMSRMGRQLEALIQRPLRIIDFDMPFGSLIGFMVKAAFASIPAIIIVGAVYLTVVVGLGGFLAAVLSARR